MQPIFKVTINFFAVARRSLFAAYVALLLCPTTAWPWGFEGHRVIAQLAEQQLQPSAQQAVDELLALEPGATLGSIASWADDTRTSENGPWHYVNFPEGYCVFVEARDCPDGQCVFAAITRFQAVLADPAAAPQTRLEALKYLVHFVGDVHQPLHAGFGEDRGGNGYVLTVDGEPSNLHRYWDYQMIEADSLGERQWRVRLAHLASPEIAATMDPLDWALESCEIVNRDGFYPAEFSSSYREQWFPVVEQRVLTAATRLAQVLNHTLGSDAIESAFKSDFDDLGVQDATENPSTWQRVQRWLKDFFSF